MVVYPKIAEPFSAGKLSLTSRLVMLPHGTGMTRRGVPTDDDVAYFERRARGRPGLIITGAAVTHVSSVMRSRGLVEAFDERVIPQLRRRVEAIHSHGVPVVGQLIHIGREMLGQERDYPPVAPSRVRSPRDPYDPVELNVAQIRDLTEGFGRSAANLKSAGYDGAEIHGAHGYLVGQFLSPAVNRREDLYGGSSERRTRFLIEVIESIRRHCGEGFILGLRLTADEELADGNRPADVATIAQTIERLGAVDYLSVTIGIRGAYVKDITWPEAAAADAARQVRAACTMPLVIAQRIQRPEVAERMLEEGVADLVGMARSFITDPDWALKAARGEPERIRPCVGLMQDCRVHAPHLRCAVNPQTGRELDPEFAPLEAVVTPRRIAVIGGGPAGLEAARVAASRGHEVRLYEATDRLGGQFSYAAQTPGRDGLRNLIDHLTAESDAVGVRIHLDTQITTLEQLGEVDAVVLATGATFRPLDNRWVSPLTKSCFEILSMGAPPPTGGGRALLVDDGLGSWWTYGVGEALVAAGWQLEIVTPKAAIGVGVPDDSVGPMLSRLGKAGTKFHVLNALEASTADGALLRGVVSGMTQTLACDLIVIQTGRQPVSVFSDRTGAEPVEFHAIGDCVTPRRISTALFEAQRLARTL